MLLKWRDRQNLASHTDLDEIPNTTQTEFFALLRKHRAQMPHNYRHIRVMALSRSAENGYLALANRTWPLALGRTGRLARKREGDGATPMGEWHPVGVYYRPDRVARPASALSVRALSPCMGWCDAPADRNYNRPVRLPYPPSAEQLWRIDGLNDILVVLDHNLRPRVRGAGSAIFLHCAHPGMAPTEGCLALRTEHLAQLIGQLDRTTRIIIA